MRARKFPRRSSSRTLAQQCDLLFARRAGHIVGESRAGADTPFKLLVSPRHRPRLSVLVTASRPGPAQEAPFSRVARLAPAIFAASGRSDLGATLALSF